MFNPISTYRFQFHRAFTFNHALELVPYLAQLGVKTVYASPVLAAAPGSSHGYDGIDPTRPNPEIGTLDEWRALSRALQNVGIRWVQDIVPNHLAYHPTNPWLCDVLEKGHRSPYAPYFDTVLSDATLFRGKLLLPFLAGPLVETVVENGLNVAYDGRRLVFRTNGNDWPLAPATYETVLTAAGAQPGLAELLDKLKAVLSEEDDAVFCKTWRGFLDELATFLTNAPGFLDVCLRVLNTDQSGLRWLADAQEYQLCYGADTRQTINYRRFFTVDGLLCLNIQHDATFRHVHALVKQLLDEGVIHGLRIDHVDGLYDPTAYLHQLRALVGDDCYVVVEKILEPGEDLPTNWPIAGTTGYDFLATLNNLLTDKRAEPAFTTFYENLIGIETNLPDAIRDRKAYVLYQHMGGELTNLYRLLLTSGLVSAEDVAVVDPVNLKLALGEILIQCPVYRYYAAEMPLPPADNKALRSIFAGIRERKPALDAATTLLENVLLHSPETRDATYRDAAQYFYQRLMQFAGPLMAKGVEDTLLYTYNRFIGHNEVGDSPVEFGLSHDEFHRQMTERQQHWPLAMNGTATHDTKRGEDVRARLNVLTALPDQWVAEVAEWQRLNADLKVQEEHAGPWPDANDEYFIYQTLIGAYPMPEASHEERSGFGDRLEEYLTKAFKEAKRHTDWVVPDDAYLAAALHFARGLLDPQRPFWPRFAQFHRRVSEFGIWNSLVQTTLKFTCPGISDTYQGCEGWDLSLVDPDNRRPVDYALRQEWLTDVATYTPENSGTWWPALWQDRFSGKIKLWLTHRLLLDRRDNVALYTEGRYISLAVTGQHAGHVLAFARQHGAEWRVVIVGLYLASLGENATSFDWEDTTVTLPADAPMRWQNLLVAGEGTTLRLAEVFATLPVAVLRLVQPLSPAQ